MIHKYSRISGVSSILAEYEQPPFEIVNRHGTARAVITCDHASNQIPDSLNLLGLGDKELAQHIAYDLGCADLSRRLSEILDAPLILGNFSRLVVDLNRHLNDPSSISETSDNIPVPGNRNISHQHAAQRIEELFVPYHNALAALLADVHAVHGVPLIIAVHSFTPVFANFERPWHIGVLWNLDERIAHPLIERLRRHAEICVGDNQPYHAKEPVGYGMDVHAESNGYPHALLEIRQDLLANKEGTDRWAELLGHELGEVMKDESLYQVMEFES